MTLGIIDHPSITNPDYTTIILSWFDGGLRFFESPPAGSGGLVLLDTYYLSYAIVILIAWILFRRWQKSGSLLCHQYQLYDMAIVTILSVLFGAKLAYVLFYYPEYYLERPWEIITNWSGMSSHGAFAGVAFGFWWYCRNQKLNFLHIADHAVIGGVMAPVFVRIANWLNGELYGRSVSADIPWAMRFPMKDELGRRLYQDHTNTVYALARDIGPNGNEIQQLVPLDRAPHHAFETFQIMQQQFPQESNPHLWGHLRSTDGGIKHVTSVITDASHPSQLYELLLGGIALLIVLLVVRSRAKVVGTVAATFLIGYGLVRIAIEMVRQQDPQRSAGFFEYVSMGQLLSFALVMFGIIMIRRSRRTGTTIESLREGWAAKLAAAHPAKAATEPQAPSDPTSP